MYYKTLAKFPHAVHYILVACLTHNSWYLPLPHHSIAPPHPHW